jgi:GNAT superfamily N-acetyltransferase
MSEASIRIRTLRSDERDDVLALLDGWPLSDGWIGRDYFRRYLEHDPHYADENLHVAEQDGALVACVQIFPRSLRVRGEVVPAGGIGTVFTSEKARGSGVASRLLEAAAVAMRERGMELSVLFATRHAFYARLGWMLWPRKRTLWVASEAIASGNRVARAAELDLARDLDAVAALHERYNALRAGTVVRDRAYWRGQLHFAGNPTEEFLVARDAHGRIEAYLRASLFEGLCAVLELGRADGSRATAALADLVVRVMTPRDDDPHAARASADFRRTVLAPAHDDAALEVELAERGVAIKSFEEKATMLRVLNGPALVRRFGERWHGEAAAEPLLRRILPAEQFVFWPADRF